MCELEVDILLRSHGRIPSNNSLSCLHSKARRVYTSRCSTDQAIEFRLAWGVSHDKYVAVTCSLALPDIFSSISSVFCSCNNIRRSKRLGLRERHCSTDFVCGALRRICLLGEQNISKSTLR